MMAKVQEQLKDVLKALDDVVENKVFKQFRKYSSDSTSLGGGEM
jgi:hypothetical protein